METCGVADSCIICAADVTTTHYFMRPDSATIFFRSTYIVHLLHTRVAMPMCVAVV